MNKLTTLRAKYPSYAGRIGYDGTYYTFDGIGVGTSVEYFDYWFRLVWEGDIVD